MPAIIINAQRDNNPDPALIRALIERTGMSQPDLGALLGVTPRTIRRWIYRDVDSEHYVAAPYSIQVCLRMLARRSNS